MKKNKNIFKLLTTHRYRRTVLSVLAVAVVASFVGVSSFAWGPSRSTYTMANPSDHVTFDSITDNPTYGDERNFLRVKDASQSDSTFSDNTTIQPGKTYEAYIFYHNNASSTLNDAAHGQKGIAQGANLKVALPSGLVANKQAQVVGTISATNAQPTQVWDESGLTATSDVALRYVPQSAKIFNKGGANGSVLADSFLTTGAPIGYDSLNGVIPGCNEYAGYITFEFTADQPNFTLTKQVSISGQNKWASSVKANPGDKVDFLLSYQNTGTTQQNNVVLKDALPTGLGYVSGSTNVANSNNPKGAAEKDGITTTGVNLGSYAPKGNIYAKFTTKVADKDALKCGVNTLTNTASALTDNGTKSATATVTVDTTCAANECRPGVPTGDKRCAGVTTTTATTPTELPTTGPAQIVAAIIGVAFIALGVAYWLHSRKTYRSAIEGISTGVKTGDTNGSVTPLLKDHTNTKPEDDKKEL